MKFALSIVCALFLFGCGDSQTQTANTPIITKENQSSTATEATVPAQPQAEENTSTSDASAPAPSAPKKTAFDASAHYTQKCVSCHGAKGEKPALGKSQIIASLSEDQIKEALKGYQIGTYGKEMKAVMQGQAKGLSEEQIDALAKHISTL